LRRGFELAGDVAALLRQAAEAVGIATHFIDAEIALMVQRPQKFGHALEHGRNMFLEYGISHERAADHRRPALFRKRGQDAHPPQVPNAIEHDEISLVGLLALARRQVIDLTAKRDGL
jgi:hypothetical protein